MTLTVTTFAAAGLLAQGVSGGLKAGLNLANQNFSDDVDISLDPRTSFHVGAYLNAAISESFSIQPELLYNSVGSKFSSNGFDVVTKLDYLTIPIMFKYNPAPIFNIQAGPQFGFLLNAKQDFDGDSQDIKDNVKSLDLGVGLGAGIDLPMGLNFTARYIIGLSDIAEEVDGNSDGKTTNNVIQISVGYRLFGGE